MQEIRGCSHVTHIANAPEHIKGIIDLRGVVVPILDLRIRFGETARLTAIRQAVVTKKTRQSDEEDVNVFDILSGWHAYDRTSRPPIAD